MGLLTLLAVGFVAGLLARLFVPGRRIMTWPATLVVGVAGSLLGGFLSKLMEGRFAITYAGLFGSLVGAIIVLGIYRMALERAA